MKQEATVPVEFGCAAHLIGSSKSRIFETRHRSFEGVFSLSSTTTES